MFTTLGAGGFISRPLHPNWGLTHIRLGKGLPVNDWINLLEERLS